MFIRFPCHSWFSIVHTRSPWFFFWRVFSVVDWYFNTMSCWTFLSHRHLICFQPSTRDIFGRITWRCQMDIIAVREKRTWSRISGTTRACHFQANLWRAQVTTPTLLVKRKTLRSNCLVLVLGKQFLPSSHLKRGHFAQFGFYALLHRAWPVSMRSDISLLTTSIRIISTGLGALHFHETTRSLKSLPGLLQPKTGGSEVSLPKISNLSKIPKHRVSECKRFEKLSHGVLKNSRKCRTRK